MIRPILFLLVTFLGCGVGCVCGDDGSDSRTLKPHAISTVLPNHLKLTDRVVCGGEPPSDEAFRQLSQLGIKTLVSVDGAKPNLELAQRYGLRYVHIPIGYDGLDDHARLSLTRLVRELDGPFYVHCHHGLHRGPAAAAVACIAAGEMDHRAAIEILQRAGTSPDYAGLWRAVESYRVPPLDAKLPELVEVAAHESLAASMAGIDRVFAKLQRCEAANWTTPLDHPDLIPHQQARLLKEGLRESSRHLSDSFEPQFRTMLSDAEETAQKIESALKTGNFKIAADHFRVLRRSCAQCHQRHRN